MSSIFGLYLPSAVDTWIHALEDSKTGNETCSMISDMAKRRHRPSRERHRSACLRNFVDLCKKLPVSIA